MQNLYLQNCDDYQLEEPWANGTPVCPLDLNLNQFAWYDEASQSKFNSPFPWESALYKKKVKADCVANTYLAYNLNNGRSCVDSNQCVSKNCLAGVC